MNFWKSTIVSILYHASACPLGFANSWLAEVIKIQKTKCIPVIFINTIQLKSGFLGEICREFLFFLSDSVGIHPRTNGMWL